MTSGGNIFKDFPENQLPKFHRIGMAASLPAMPFPASLEGTSLRPAV